MMRYSRVVFFTVMISCTLISSVMARGQGCETKKKGPAVLGQITNSLYLRECGQCHFAFHPHFLPKRSWEKLMGSLGSHFGKRVTLTEVTSSAIGSYLVRNSAESSTAQISAKILASIGRSDIPLRVTDTDYFKQKHKGLHEEVYKRKTVRTATNCAACHVTAGRGDFEAIKVKIPKC